MKRTSYLILFVLAATAAFASIPRGRTALANIAANASVVKTTNTFTQSLPSSLSPAYDANGNLTSDGLHAYEYDDADRLCRITVTNAWRSEFVYDGLSRRRITRDYTWQSSIGNWQLSNEARYVYDRMLIVQERDINNVPLVTYTRGLDLSGTFQGAGGIGGLLARTDHTTSNPLLATAFYHADGAGNITALVSPQGFIQASYLYNPFGRLAGKWGPLADANVMQFSSQPLHRASGLILYPFRAYDPGLQRWLNQDPIGELGGVNLYGFVGNSPASYIDPDGSSLMDVVNTVNAIGNPIATAVQNAVGPQVERLNNAIADNARQVAEGLYDMAMGDTPGRYDQNTKGAMDGANGLVDIDRDNNALRDSAGELGRLSALTAAVAAESMAAGKLLEGASSTRCPRKSPKPKAPPPPPAAPTADAAMGEGPGAMTRLQYEANPKHGPTQVGDISPRPANGQGALDNSVTYKSTNTGRVGLDDDGTPVVLRQHGDGTYHGYRVQWQDLATEQQNALMKTFGLNRKGR